MRTGDGGLALIKRFEGLRTRAYRDPVGILTIGYGHTSAAGQPFVTDGMVITKGEAENILCADLARVEDAVDDVTTRGPNQNQFDAMVSLCFNIGPTAFAKSSVLRLFNDDEDEAAANAFLRWNKAGGKVLAGLTSRSKAEAELFRREAPVIMTLASTQETSMEPKKYWNLNALQSLLTALLGAVPIVFAAFGCAMLPNGALDCSVSPFFTPKMALIASTILTVLKLAVIPAIQDGGWFRNIVSPKVPVSNSGAPGTVDPGSIQPPTAPARMKG